MFEDSLVESTGRIRTRSKWFAIGSFLLQAALLSALILIPFFHPAALPKQALTMMLVAPPPPPTRPDIPAHTAAARAASPAPLDALTAPPVIPRHAAMVDDRVPGPIDISAENRSGPGNIDPLHGLGTPPPPPVIKPEPKPRPGPLRISAGIAEGRLIAPIRPVYPAIAQQARIQGTVVVEATISKQGTGGACPRGERAAHTGRRGIERHRAGAIPALQAERRPRRGGDHDQRNLQARISRASHRISTGPTLSGQPSGQSWHL